MTEYLHLPDAVFLTACPTCRARIGERCKTRNGETHKRRINRVAPKKKRPGEAPRSVQALLGGAFEMNRRRH